METVLAVLRTFAEQYLKLDVVMPVTLVCAAVGLVVYIVRDWSKRRKAKDGEKKWMTGKQRRQQLRLLVCDLITSGLEDLDFNKVISPQEKNLMYLQIGNALEWQELLPQQMPVHKRRHLFRKLHPWKVESLRKDLKMRQQQRAKPKEEPPRGKFTALPGEKPPRPPRINLKEMLDKSELLGKLFTRKAS